MSEVQLMHNLGEHKQVQERREWLQRRLHGVHTIGLNNDGEPGWGRDLTPEEVQNALNVLQELLKSQQ